MISIIIPTLNEEEGIVRTIRSIPKKIRREAELIVVDVSTDETPRIAKELGAKVLRPKRRGKGYQMRYAVRRSKGDILIFLDGDGTDPGGFIPALLRKLDSAQLVLGCRSLERVEGEDPDMRSVFQIYRIIATPMALTFRLTFQLNVSDPLAGFRAIRRKDWDALSLKSNDFDIETEMNIEAIRNGFKIAEVKIPNLERCGGFQTSKFLKSPKMWLKIFKMLLDFNLEKSKNLLRDIS